MVDIERVRALMARHELSPAELARKAGMDRRGVARLLAGADVRASSLEKVAAALQTSADYLLGRGTQAARPIVPELIEALGELDEANQREVLVYALFKSGRLYRPPLSNEQAQSMLGGRGGLPKA